MALLQALKRALTVVEPYPTVPVPTTVAAINDPTVPITGTTILQLLEGGARALAGPVVTPRTGLTMPAVYRAVNVIAGTCASLPLHAYRRQNDERVPAADHGHATTLLGEPHPDLTPFELWEVVYGHLAMWGNAYLERRRDGLDLTRQLWPITPDRVRPGRASDGTKVYLVDGGTDGEVALTDREILHIPLFGYDGIAGLSPIGLARNGIGLALAAEQYGSKLFASGSLSSGILQTEQRLTQDQADLIQKRWQQRAAGLDNAHQVTVLGSGAKFQPISIPPDDAQFLESREASRCPKWPACSGSRRTC
jgi:HK97 family phage portal protein